MNETIHQAIQKKTWITMNAFGSAINTLLLFCFIFLAASGLFVLGKIHGDQLFLGFSKHSWEELHERLGFIMILLASAHLFLHKQWLTKFFKRELFGDKKYYPRIALVSLVGMILIIAIMAISLLEK